MATYEDIYGKRVKEFDSDPTLTSSYEGQVWYDKSSGTLRSVVAFGAWASSSSLAGAVRSAVGSSGTQTASLSVGGEPGPGYFNLVEEYNGSGWATATNYPLSIQGPLVAGTQTAAVVCGGNTYPPSVDRTDTFEYDGSSFSSSGALPAGRRGLNNTGFGSQTAAVQSGGLTPGGTHNTSNEYDGSSWTAGNTINTTRYVHAGAGTLTAGIISSGVGAAPSYTSLTNVEEYDGTTFTAVNSMSTGHGATAGSNQAPQTSLIVFGGNSTPGPSINNTESYDGTNWTTQPNMASARQQLGGSGSSSSSGLAFAGYTTTAVGTTEEFTSSINTITAAAWSSGGAYPTATADVGSAGTRTAGLIFGGDTPAPAVTAATNEYDGSAFSGGGNVVDGRAFMTGLGTQTAAVGVGGAPSFVTNSESYNGSSWSEGNNINTARGNAMAAGTQTAGLLFGGYNGSSLANTENYDGTSWTNNPNGLNTARRGSGGCGTQTAALCAAGYSTTYTAVVEEYNGTSWSEVTNVPLKRHAFRCVGTQTAALGSGGYLPGPQGGPGNLPTNSITYDGTTWSTNPSLATGSSRGGQAGTTTASFVTAGQLGSGTTTENFDVGTETVTAKTLTTS